MNGTYEARTIAKLQSKEYRDAFVESHARTGISFQLRAMRAARGWSQEDLGARAEMGQNVVARLENPDYGKFSISSLLKLASAFDVALMVRFVRFSDLLARTKNLTPEALNVPSFSEDQSLQDSDSVTWPEQHTGLHADFVAGQIAGDATVIKFPNTPQHGVGAGPRNSGAWTTLDDKPTNMTATARAVQ